MAISHCYRSAIQAEYTRYCKETEKLMSEAEAADTASYILGAAPHLHKSAGSALQLDFSNKPHVGTHRFKGNIESGQAIQATSLLMMA